MTWTASALLKYNAAFLVASPLWTSILALHVRPASRAHAAMVAPPHPTETVGEPQALCQLPMKETGLPRIVGLFDNITA